MWFSPQPPISITERPREKSTKAFAATKTMQIDPHGQPSIGCVAAARRGHWTPIDDCDTDDPTTACSRSATLTMVAALASSTQSCVPFCPRQHVVPSRSVTGAHHQRQHPPDDGGSLLPWLRAANVEISFGALLSMRHGRLSGKARDHWRHQGVALHRDVNRLCRHK